MFAESVHNRKSHLKEPLFLPAIILERDSTIPLHRQIYRQIALAIRGGAIHSGARLPSTRWMAGFLDVSRNTVLAAYDDLAADDLVRGMRGSAMRVIGRAPFPEVTLFALRRVMREASYPARILGLADPDGNPLYINF
jgi:DNA-binding transcriptional regulator YhcF (GntR family)